MLYFTLNLFIVITAGFLDLHQAISPPCLTDQKPVITTDEVRKKLNFSLDADALLNRIPPLVALGEDIFPALEQILVDPKSERLHVANALLVLRTQEMEKFNRKRFLEPVCALLVDADSRIRISALGVLKQIGTERDTAPVAALLSDENVWVGVTAAETLQAIGGKRDLIAMDAWLKSGIAHRKHSTYPDYVKECRDKLAQRLKEAEQKEKEKK